MFLTAIAVFTLASVGCAASTSLGELVAMRVLQGAGGAMMVPVGRTDGGVARPTSGTCCGSLLRRRGRGCVAPVIAPLAGGLITTYASWHWIFLINVPLGVLAFCVAWRLVEAREGAGTRRRLTGPGVVLTCAGLGGLTYAAHLVVADRAAARPQTAAIGAASAALLAGVDPASAPRAGAAAQPAHARRPDVRRAVARRVVYWLVVGATPFLLPLLFQTLFGWAPVKSGAVVLFIFVGNMGIKPATTPLINRFGFRARARRRDGR